MYSFYSIKFQTKKARKIMTAFAIISLILSVAGMAISAGMQQSANNINSQTAKDINQSQIDYSREAAETANEQTRQNYWELYSPQAKVQQYKEAGLSPALMYSMGGVSGTGQTAAQGAQPGAIMPQINPLVNGNVMKDLSETFANSADNDLKKSEKNKNEQEVKNMQKEIEVADAKIKELEELAKNHTVSSANLDLQNKLLENEKKISDATVQDQIEIIKKNKELIQANIDKTQKEIDILKIDESKRTEFLDAEIKKMKALENLYYKQATLALANSLLADAQEQLARKKTALMDVEKNEIVARTGFYTQSQEKLKKEVAQLTEITRKLKVEADKAEALPWTSNSNGPLDKILNVAMDLGADIEVKTREYRKWAEKNRESIKKTFKTGDWSYMLDRIIPH